MDVILKEKEIMEKVIVYTTKNCPYCIAVKNLFKSLSVPFDEVFLDNNQELWEKLSKENNGWRTVPMVFINNQFIGGFDDTNTLHKSGKLLSIINH